MDFSYTFILAVVLILSPFVLALAQKQDKQFKQKLKYIFLTILSSQLILGLLNWENFTAGPNSIGAGRNGYELALAYPNSLLGLFFGISILQISLLLISKSFNTATVVLNFINSVLIFASMIRLSSLLGFQAVSFASIGAVFLVLIGNVVALALINKDKNLLKKYPLKR